jgi:uncharacterized membrane protein
MAGTKKFPLDLLLAAVPVILTDICILIPPLSGSFISTALGLPMALFLPGYALIAALFPAKNDLEGIERVELSFGLSIAIMLLIGLGLNYTLGGIRLISILMGLSGFALVMCGAAYLRRRQFPEDEAFATHIKASIDLPENLRQISLDHGATWEEPVTIPPPFEGRDMKLEFLLFNETEKRVPCRDLHLWINVAREA